MASATSLMIMSIVSFFPHALYAFCFEDAGKMYSISPVLLRSIAMAESNLDQKAMNRNKNGSVDIGLMQVNSYWITRLGLDRSKLASDSCYNITVGASILRQCINRHGYTWEAVGCYNAVSMDKKKAYSWRIFRQLKSGNHLMTAGGDLQEKQKSGSSSLSFRAWDIIESSFGSDSQNVAGRIP